jgi:pilus assembly protein CpaC
MSRAESLEPRTSSSARSAVRLYRTVSLLALGLALVPIMSHAEQRRAAGPVTTDTGVQATRALSLPINKSQVLRVNQTIRRIAVGNPAIADVAALTDRSFYILGKAVGTTNVAVYGPGDSLIAVVDVVVGSDVEGVKSTLNEILPGERIEVRPVNDSIALSGSVSSPAKANQAVAIAQRYLPEKVTVINNLSVHGSQQVMLQVKVAEVNRTVSKQLGLTPSVRVGAPGSITGLFASSSSTTALSSFVTAMANAISGNFALNMNIDALEQKGLIKILAEPNLVAMSGDTANFLAGGEFPVPTNETTNTGVPTITVEFKPFGVSLAFTPTVIGDGLINLVVAPEVSEIDKQTAPVIINGFEIPGISTRRARTTVELRDGQAFAIAGLLQSDFSDQIQQIPGFGNIPILGALARDSQFQRKETELVIIITPHLVQPAPADALVAPTDSFAPPSDVDIFFHGNPEAPNSGVVPAVAGGGLTGRYGHIIR